jgi:hypothetical protein
LTKGTRVVITFGPFTGFEGTILSSRNGRVALRLRLEKRWLQVELDEDMVTRATSASRIPAGHSSTSRSRAAAAPESGLRTRAAGIPAKKDPAPRNGSHQQRGSGKPSPDR